MQDHDAVGVVGVQRLRPGHRVVAADRLKRHGVDIGALGARQLGDRAVAARDDARRHELAHVRERPALLRKARPAAVGEANELVRRRRRADHPAHDDGIAGARVERRLRLDPICKATAPAETQRRSELRVELSSWPLPHPHPRRANIARAIHVYDEARQLGGRLMATFVLVHGAWHGSWCWKRVRKALQAEGHDVFTPTLTGVGERSHLMSPQVGLDTHIADVVNLIRWEELTDVVLCGHSYGGCVITGVADRVAERFKRSSISTRSSSATAKACTTYYRRKCATAKSRRERRVNGWQVQPITAEFFRVNTADRAWVDKQCTPQPLATFAQPVRLRKSMPAEKSTHILATGYEYSPFPPFHEIAKRKGWKTLTIDCGHDVMLDRPDELVAMLRDAAT